MENEILTVEEEKRFEELEKIIKKDLKSFVRVGMALKEINENKLYRHKYNSFKDYLKVVWDISKTYAYNQIQAFDVIENLKQDVLNCGHLESKIPDQDNVISILPHNEAQTRPLTLLSPIQQVAAWKKVLKKTKSKPTALEVSKVVDDFLERKRQTEKDNIIVESKRAVGVPDDFNEAFSSIVEVIEKHRVSGWKNFKRKKAIALITAITDYLK